MALVDELPPGYRLVDTAFELGDVQDETDGPGWFTFYVAGRAYAVAVIDTERVIEHIRARRVPDARAELQAEFPLAQPPQLVTWPEWPERLAWLERVPLLPLRIDVHVSPEFQDVEDVTTRLPGLGWRVLVEGARTRG